MVREIKVHNCMPKEDVVGRLERMLKSNKSDKDYYERLCECFN